MRDNPKVSIHKANTSKYNSKMKAANSNSRWLSYAAAGAAGAAALATGQHSDAAVVLNGGSLLAGTLPFTQTPNTLFSLDLDNNGTTDVEFHNFSLYNFSGNSTYGGRAVANGNILGVFGQNNPQYSCTAGSVSSVCQGGVYTGVGGGGSYNYTINFSRVSSIGPKFTNDFVSPRPKSNGYWDYAVVTGAATSASGYYGAYMRDGGAGFALSGWNSLGYSTNYHNNAPGFLGVQFDIDGATHYGFVELVIDLSVRNTASPDGPANVVKILNYGYEDVADAQISGPGDANFVRNDFQDDDPNGPLTSTQTNWFRATDGVDGADFLQWQRGFGGVSPSQRDGDANRDGVVDGQDLSIWQNQYGEARRSPSTPLGANNGAVPEPNSLGLMALGATGLLALRRIRPLRKSNKRA